eukprot:1512734-Pleurochrysis_carterae.AAC.1
MCKEVHPSGNRQSGTNSRKSEWNEKAASEQREATSKRRDDDGRELQRRAACVPLCCIDSSARPDQSAPW